MMLLCGNAGHGIYMHNLYDNEQFFSSYLELRGKESSLNHTIEIPAFRTLVNDCSDKLILDLGCGFGEACSWYILQGAKGVVGIDSSERMIGRARLINCHDRIKYICQPMENIELPDNGFDIVASSLAFHYIQDFSSIIAKINKILKPGGTLVFSQEHPVITAKAENIGWITGNQNEKLYWAVDNYSTEGIRHKVWMNQNISKYHRTMSTILNTLTENNFNIIKVLEPLAGSKFEDMYPQLLEERRRPPFLIVKADKN